MEKVKREMDKNHRFLPNRVHKQVLRELPWDFLIAAALHMTLLVVQKGKAKSQPRDNSELFATHNLLYVVSYSFSWSFSLWKYFNSPEM